MPERRSEMTNAEAAEILGVTVHRVQEMVREGTFVRSRPGHLDNVASWKSYFAKLAADKPTEARVEAERRLAVAKATAAELELAREQGRLVDLDVASDDWTRIVSTLKAQVRAVPSKCATRGVGLKTPAEVRDVVKEQTDACLREIAEYGRRLQRR